MRSAPLLAVLLAAAGCGPQAASSTAPRTSRNASAVIDVELESLGFDAATQAQLDAQAANCSYCSGGVTVRAFDIDQPATGTLTIADTKESIFFQSVTDPQTPWGDYGALSRSGVVTQLGNWGLGQVLGIAEQAIGVSGQAAQGELYSWQREVQPDACDAGRFFIVLYPDARKIITIELGLGYEC